MGWRAAFRERTWDKDGKLCHGWWWQEWSQQGQGSNSLSPFSTCQTGHWDQFGLPSTRQIVREPSEATKLVGTGAQGTQGEAESWVCSESRRQGGILSLSATPSWDGVKMRETQAFMGEARRWEESQQPKIEHKKFPLGKSFPHKGGQTREQGSRLGISIFEDTQNPPEKNPQIKLQSWPFQSCLRCMSLFSQSPVAGISVLGLPPLIFPTSTVLKFFLNNTKCTFAVCACISSHHMAADV